MKLFGTRKKKEAEEPEALPFDYASSVEDMLLPNRLVFTTRHIQQNDFLRRVCVVKNYPASFSEVCVLRKLATTKGVTLKIHLRPLTPGQVSTLCNNQLQNKKAIRQNKGKTGEQIKAEFESDNIKRVYRDFLAHNEKFYYVTIFIEFYGSDGQKLQEKAETVKSLLQGYGMTTDSLIFEQKQAFQSILPYGRSRLPYLSRNMPSSTIAALFPFSESSRVDDRGAFLGHTTDNGPIIIDFKKRDAFNTNGNVSIVGESGQGKTTLSKIIMTFLIATGWGGFALDPEGEYSSLFTGLGGTRINCATGEIRINFFDVRSIARDDDELDADLKKSHDDSLPAFHEKGAFRQHLSWLRDFFKVLRPYATEAEINIIMILAQDVYASHGIHENFDPIGKSPDVYPTMTDLYEYIRDVYHNWEKYCEKYDMFARDALQNILLMLKDTYDGSEAHLFNGHTNVPNDGVISFDLNTLLQGSKDRTSAVLFNITTWIWNKVCLRQRHIFLDIAELYLMIDRKNLTMAYYLRDFMKRARKYMAILITDTQNLGDLLDPELRHITSVLFNNPNYKFMFYPGELDFKAVRDVLKLTDGEMSIISETNKGKCLFKAGKEKFHLEVEMLPFMEKLFGSRSGL